MKWTNEMAPQGFGTVFSLKSEKDLWMQIMYIILRISFHYLHLVDLQVNERLREHLTVQV